MTEGHAWSAREGAEVAAQCSPISSAPAVEPAMMERKTLGPGRLAGCESSAAGGAIQLDPVAALLADLCLMEMSTHGAFSVGNFWK